MTRLLCIADLHLGRCPSGVDRAERLAEQEAVWAQALQVGAEHDVDAVLFAGDLFEGPIPTPEHYAAFARPLRESSLPVVAISGNGKHDAAMRDTNAVGMLDALGVPRLQLFTRPDFTWLGNVAVACLPWTPVSRLVAAQGGGDRDSVHQDATDMLLRIASGLRSETDGPCVLLTHFSISGATLPGGMSSDQLREVVLPLSDLQEIGFDAIVAGHLHPPQYVADGMGWIQPEGSWGVTADVRKDTPYGPCIYAGSPMPLDFGEGATDHGVWILDVAHEHARFEFVPLESRGFETIDVNPDDDPPDDGGRWFSEYLSRLSGAYVKLRLRGTAEQVRRYDLAEVRETLLNDGAHQVWIEPHIVRESRARVAALDETVSDVDALDLWLGTQEMGDDAKVALRRMHAGYLEAVV